LLKLFYIDLLSEQFEKEYGKQIDQEQRMVLSVGLNPTDAVYPLASVFKLIHQIRSIMARSKSKHIRMRMERRQKRKARTKRRKAALKQQKTAVPKN
jgi:hypothetical protein